MQNTLKGVETFIIIFRSYLVREVTEPVSEMMTWVCVSLLQQPKIRIGRLEKNTSRTPESNRRASLGDANNILCRAGTNHVYDTPLILSPENSVNIIVPIRRRALQQHSFAFSSLLCIMSPLGRHLFYTMRFFAPSSTSVYLHSFLPRFPVSLSDTTFAHF